MIELETIEREDITDAFSPIVVGVIGGDALNLVSILIKWTLVPALKSIARTNDDRRRLHGDFADVVMIVVLVGD